MDHVPAIWGLPARLRGAPSPHGPLDEPVPRCSEARRSEALRDDEASPFRGLIMGTMCIVVGFECPGLYGALVLIQQSGWQRGMDGDPIYTQNFQNAL